MKLGGPWPPVRVAQVEVLGELALDNTCVDRLERVVKDALDLVGVGSERGHKCGVRDESDDG